METVSVKLLRDCVMNMCSYNQDLRRYLYINKRGIIIDSTGDSLNFIRWAVSGKKNKFFSTYRKREVHHLDEIYDFYCFGEEESTTFLMENQLSLMTTPLKGSLVKLKKLRNDFGIGFNQAFYEDAPRAATLEDFVAFNCNLDITLY